MVYTMIVFAIILVANIASQDFHFEKDFTENRVNVLSDQTLKLLGNLKEPVKVMVFFADQHRSKPVLKFILDKFSKKTRKLKVDFFDPDKDKLLAEKYKASDGIIVYEQGEKSHLSADVSEQGITNAIMKVSRNTEPVVCFTKGHGEADIDGAQEQTRSLSMAKGGIANEGYISKSVEFLSGGVPKDCTILAVAGPQQAFRTDLSRSNRTLWPDFLIGSTIG